MLASPLDEENFGLKRRTTRNKLFVPNYDAKLATNYCFWNRTSLSTGALLLCRSWKISCQRYGLKWWTWGPLPDDLRRLAKIVLALGWIFSNQYFAWKACFNFHHTPLFFPTYDLGRCLLLLLCIRSAHLEILLFPSMCCAYWYRDIFAWFKTMWSKQNLASASGIQKEN